MGRAADLWGDGREFSLDRLSLGKGRDRSLRKIVLEACERGRVGFAFGAALDGSYRYSSGSNKNIPYFPIYFTSDSQKYQNNYTATQQYKPRRVMIVFALAILIFFIVL